MFQGFFGSDAFMRVVNENLFEEVEELLVEIGSAGDYVLIKRLVS